MLIDGFGRKVDYLRVSVTERCNFRCQYCMPEKPFSWVPRENLLSYEDMFKFIKVSIDEGIKKVRITGGEPLLREGLDIFLKMIFDYKNDIDLALTTNGFLLAKVAQKLKDAGLKRINISLDSLNSATAAKIAQKDVLKGVLEGIQAAADAGLKIKINCVPIKGINDNDVLDILEFCKDKKYIVLKLKLFNYCFYSLLNLMSRSKFNQFCITFLIYPSFNRCSVMRHSRSLRYGFSGRSESHS